jgi:hypothetical protein
MRDHSDRVQPRLQSERHLLAAEVARELRLLSLSEGLSLRPPQGRRDPRFEKELKRWLERARECGLNDENAELLGAAVAALEGEFRELALDVIERARRQLRAIGFAFCKPQRPLAVGGARVRSQRRSRRGRDCRGPRRSRGRDCRGPRRRRRGSARRAAREDDLARGGGVDEGPHLLARALEALGRLLGEQVDAAVELVYEVS